MARLGVRYYLALAMPTRQDLALLGKSIAATRRAKGYSQENFALEAGMARAYYGGIERGQRNPSASNIMRIAVALGVEVGDLFPTLKELKKVVRSR